MKIYDVAIIGAGGIGSAILYQLIRRGVTCCAIEQFQTGHDHGGTHGESRIIRKAYPENPDYIPLLEAAYSGWDALEEASGCRLKDECGFLLAGPAGSDFIRNSEAAYRRFPLAHERWDSAGTRKHFPQFHLPEESTVFFDPFGGYLRVDDCLAVMQKLALEQGAEIFSGETVLGWQSEAAGVRIKTARQQLRARKLIIASGAWAAPELLTCGISLEIWRRIIFWYGREAEFCPAAFPSFFIEHNHTGFYGCPAISGLGLKIGEHHIPFKIAGPEQAALPVTPAEEMVVEQCVRDIFPQLNGKAIASKSCLYALSPDRHFILDLHPHQQNVLLACGFSGHGYKFAPAVGEIMADLALEGNTTLPIDFLRLYPGRFAQLP